MVIWMIIEFYGYDEQLRIYTAIPFSIGLFFILVYYGIIYRGITAARSSKNDKDDKDKN